MIDRAALLAIVNRPTEAIPTTPVLEDPEPVATTAQTARLRAIRSDVVAWKAQGDAIRANVLASVITRLANGTRR